MILLTKRFLLIVVFALFMKCDNLIMFKSIRNVDHHLAMTQINDFREFFHILMKQSNNNDKLSVSLIDDLIKCGMTSTYDVIQFSKDFESRPEILSQILKTDFEFNPINSHKLRAAMIELLSNRYSSQYSSQSSEMSSYNQSVTTATITDEDCSINETLHNISNISTNITVNKLEKVKKLNFKSFHVTSISRSNRTLTNNPDISSSAFDLSITKDYSSSYGIRDIPSNVEEELNRFLKFMITASANNPEEPIRKSTAKVYVTHTKLFLGWYMSHKLSLSNQNISNRVEKRKVFVKLHHRRLNRFTGVLNLSNSSSTLESLDEINLKMLFPSQSRSGADVAYEFIQWLRDTRKISVTYEANIIRGLTKLAKYLYHSIAVSIAYMFYL